MPFGVVAATDPDGSRDCNGPNYPGVSLDGATKSPQIAAECVSPMTDSFETGPLRVTRRRKQQINVFIFFLFGGAVATTWKSFGDCPNARTPRTQTPECRLHS